MAADLVGQETEQMNGSGMIRLGRQNLPVERLSLGESSSTMMFQSNFKRSLHRDYRHNRLPQDNS